MFQMFVTNVSKGSLLWTVFYNIYILEQIRWIVEKMRGVSASFNILFAFKDTA